MKRLLLSSIAAIAFALIAAPPAGANVTTAVVNASPLCGHSYAMLLTGNGPSTQPADGSTTLPGALTAAVGVGAIQFDALGTNGPNGCLVTSGELIFNAGDFQSNPNAAFFGPNHCYDAESVVNTGVPCFDGLNHFTSAALSNPGPNGNGSQSLTFTAGFNWFDLSDSSGSIPFAFTVQPNVNGAIAFGTSVPAPGAPILTLVLQKQSVVPVATTYGAAPYLGNSIVSINNFGANGTDEAAAQNASLSGGVLGSFESIVGAIQIFSNGIAGGSLSYNSNNSITTSGFTGTPPNNGDCAIDVLPGTQIDPLAGAFSDGTNNTLAILNTSASPCTQTALVQAFMFSSVQWGPADTSSYFTTTGIVNSDQNSFIPPGFESSGTTVPARAGSLRTSVTANFTLVQRAGGNTSRIVTVTNSSPATCNVTFTMPGPIDATCHLFLSNSGIASPYQGDAAQTGTTVTCTCANSPPDTLIGSLTIASSNCPVTTGTGPFAVTCHN